MVVATLVSREAWQAAIAFLGEPVGHLSNQLLDALTLVALAPALETFPPSWRVLASGGFATVMFPIFLNALVSPPDRLSRYARAVALGVAPPDLPIYSTALRAQSDPSVLDDLPGEERDAVELLLSAAAAG